MIVAVIKEFNLAKLRLGTPKTKAAFNLRRVQTFLEEVERFR